MTKTFDMEEQYVTFKTAMLLQKAGFDVPCTVYYECDCERNGIHRRNSCVKTNHNYDWPSAYYSCPTQVLVAKWLREKHKLHVIIDAHDCHTTNGIKTVWYYTICPIGDCSIIESSVVGVARYRSYEEAMEKGIQEAVDLILQNKKKQEDKQK